MITDSASSTKTPPTIGSSNSCLMSRATVPSAPPRRERADVAHEDLRGCALHHRKPRLAPTSAPQKIVSSPRGAAVDELQVLGELGMAGHT